MNESLYGKYRPQNFASVVGQKPAVSVLTNSLKRGRPGHAYLFSGSRGCGKTSVARIFAKAINCQNPQGVEPCGECWSCKAITEGQNLDVLEIDGASNNGVEQIRGLKENVSLAPFSSKRKIYIIDEVHMLTTAAFNALLKTLEEPPEHVIFIMATTEPQKVPVTIRSRCQHIPFHSIRVEDIYARLDEVCRLEGVSAESEALWEIARQADGALRDALSLLEQVMSYGEVTLANVESSFGAGSRSAFERWVKTFRTDKESAYKILKSMFDSGASGVRIFEEMFSLVRNLWLVSRWKNIADSLEASEQEKSFLNEEAASWKSDELHGLLNIIMKVLTNARQGFRSDILLGMFFAMVESPAEVSAPVVQSKPARDNNNDSAPSIARFVKTETPADVPVPVIEKEKHDDIKPNDVTVDEVLREKLITAAHTADNLVMLAGLFDSRPYEQDGNLILDFAHHYSYEVFSNDQRAAEFPEMFADYGSIHIRYGSLDITCPKSYEIKREVKPEVKSEHKAETKQAEPEKIFSREESKSESKPQPVKQEKPGNSVFDKIRGSLSRNGIKCEIVLTRTKAPESELESESESESETETESGGEE